MAKENGFVPLLIIGALAYFFLNKNSSSAQVAAIAAGPAVGTSLMPATVDRPVQAEAEPEPVIDRYAPDRFYVMPRESDLPTKGGIIQGPRTPSYKPYFIDGPAGDYSELRLE